MVNYREFRFSKLNTPQFSHLKLLLFWPIFGLLFLFVERIGTDRAWRVMHCALDDKIPFCEYFVIPYMLWFVYLVGMLLYTLLFDIPSFKRMMWFTIFTYSVTVFIYLIYPTSQELRPTVFERDNLFTRFLAVFYQFDTNTNVNPSIHVIGSMGVMFTAWNAERFKHSTPWKLAFTLVGLLICLSTLFIKQHSVIDIACAFLLSAIFYPVMTIDYKGAVACESTPKSAKERKNA